MFPYNMVQNGLVCGIRDAALQGRLSATSNRAFYRAVSLAQESRVKTKEEVKGLECDPALCSTSQV